MNDQQDIVLSETEVQNAPGRVNVWISAARLRTLPAAVAPVLVGTALAARSTTLISLTVVASFAGAIFLQLAANFVNDLADFQKGADGAGRLGPVRAAASGQLSVRQLWGGTMAALLGTLVAGCWLMFVGGWPIFVIGVAGAVAAITYTAGPWPYGYHGLGDVMVLLFFGPVAVGGTVWVHLGYVTQTAWLLGLANGLIAAAILAVNNIRDLKEDRSVHKNTLAVRLGARGMILVYRLEILAALVLPWIAVWNENRNGNSDSSVVSTYLWLILPAAEGLRLIWLIGKRQGVSLNLQLGQTARLLGIYSMLLALSLI